ncbi:MAG: ribonuclease III [Hyphomicrobiales bacterium]
MGKAWQVNVDGFEGRLGYAFRDRALLEAALTHASAIDDGHGDDNERLEFLGDRVLALVMVEELFRLHPDAREGELARRLNTLVRKETCAEVSRALGVADAMKAGRSVRRRAIAESTNVLGDTCEALIGAIYLDGGLEAARRFVLASWQPFLDSATMARKDPKTALQEWALARALPVPAYDELGREGPDHLPQFSMRVTVDGSEPATGVGRTKRQAEQEAATAFLKREGVWSDDD